MSLQVTGGGGRASRTTNLGADTVCFWLKLDAADPDNWSSFWSYQNASGQWRSIYAHDPGDGDNELVYSSNTDNTAPLVEPLQSAGWVFVAMVADSPTTVAIYYRLDGDASITQYTTGEGAGMANGLDQLNLFELVAYGEDIDDGKITSYKEFSGQLSGAQLMTESENRAPQASGVVCYLPCDAGTISGGSLLDDSGNSNDFAITGTISHSADEPASMSTSSATTLTLPVTDVEADAPAPVADVVVALPATDVEAALPAPSTSAEATLTLPATDVEAQAPAPAATVGLSLPATDAEGDVPAPGAAIGLSLPASDVEAETPAPDVSIGLALPASDVEAEMPSPSTAGATELTLPATDVTADAPAPGATVGVSLTATDAGAELPAPSTTLGASLPATDVEAESPAPGASLGLALPATEAEAEAPAPSAQVGISLTATEAEAELSPPAVTGVGEVALPTTDVGGDLPDASASVGVALPTSDAAGDLGAAIEPLHLGGEPLSIEGEPISLDGELSAPSVTVGLALPASDVGAEVSAASATVGLDLPATDIAGQLPAPFFGEGIVLSLPSTDVAAQAPSPRATLRLAMVTTDGAVQWFAPQVAAQLSTHPVESIATDQDLVDCYPRVLDAQPNLLRRTRARELALDEIESWLAQRRPSVRLEHLEDVTELRDSVVYRALVILCQAAITQEGDAFYFGAKAFAKDFASEFDRSFTVHGGAQGPPRAVSLWRG